MIEYLTVGEIANTHGVHGELKVLPITSDINRYDYLKLVWIEVGEKKKEYFVEKVRYHKQFVLVTLRGVDSVEKASELKGCFLMVDRENARLLEEDEYFITDLMGCDVYEEETLLGKITDVLQTGGNDVYIVSGEKYGEILIPAIVSVVKTIDVEKKKISVILPEGLVDDHDF